MKIDLSKKEKIWLIVIGLLIFTTPIIFTSNWGLISFGEADSKIANTIGGITAPFLSFFGSILVFLALKAQVDANDKIQKQFDEQKIIDYRQNFENTFFHLLSIHHRIIENIDINSKDILNHDWVRSFINRVSIDRLDIQATLDPKGEDYKATDVFSFSLKYLNSLIYLDLLVHDIVENTNDEYYERGKYFFLNFKQETISGNNVDVKSNFNKIYNSIYHQLSSNFGHYFRNLYRIIKMVDEQVFEKDEVKNFKIQYLYTSIIRAQLSDAEVQWLFLNCLSDKGYKKFKPLVEKYTLLKIINRDKILYKFYAKLYKESAFEKPKTLDLHKHISSYKR